MALKGVNSFTQNLHINQSINKVSLVPPPSEENDPLTKNQWSGWLCLLVQPTYLKIQWKIIEVHFIGLWYLFRMLNSEIWYFKILCDTTCIFLNFLAAWLDIFSWQLFGSFLGTQLYSIWANLKRRFLKYGLVLPLFSENPNCF